MLKKNLIPFAKFSVIYIQHYIEKESNSEKDLLQKKILYILVIGSKKINIDLLNETNYTTQQPHKKYVVISN